MDCGAGGRWTKDDKAKRSATIVDVEYGVNPTLWRRRRDTGLLD